MAERMIEVNGFELCTEPFGDPCDPPVLLVMGVGGSMLWWEEGFCRLLAAGGRFVVRYDHRDTGRLGHLRTGPSAVQRCRSGGRCRRRPRRVRARGRARGRRLG